MVDNVDKYRKLFSNQINALFDEEGNQTLLPHLVHFAIVMKDLDISCHQQKEILNILVNNKDYYFQNNYSLFDGIPLLSIVFLINKVIIGEEYVRIQKQLLALIQGLKIDIQDFRNVEYINGISGLLNYYLILYHDECSLISNDQIYMLIEFIMKYVHRKVYNTLPLNLGLSHGIAGILLVLTKAYKAGFEMLGMKGIIWYLQNILITQYFHHELRIPGIINRGEVIFPRNTPSWCYSELGVLHAIIQSTQVLGFSLLSILFEEELKNVIQNMNDYKIISPNFCHGYSGIFVFATLYGVSNEESNGFLLDQIESFYDPECLSIFYDQYYNLSGEICSDASYSFLDGSISILLSLLFVEGYNTDIWEEMLLLK